MLHAISRKSLSMVVLSENFKFVFIVYNITLHNIHSD